MAELKVRCPSCLTPLQADETQIGKKARCAQCGNSFIISKPEWEAGEIHKAAATGDAAGIAILLDADPTLVHLRAERDWTPLHIAAEHGHEAAAKMLLDRGARINAKADDETMPLHVASAEGVIKLLISRGADMFGRNGRGFSPLHQAVVDDRLPVVKVLVANDAGVQGLDFDGQTPLHQARSAEAARLLLEGGADPHARDDAGQTPLHVAATNDRLDVAKVLLSWSAEVDPKDKTGRTPLHYAVEGKFVVLIKTLLAVGADMDADDDSDTTPAMLAQRAGYANLLDLLMSLSAGPVARPEDMHSMALLLAWRRHVTIDSMERDVCAAWNLEFDEEAEPQGFITAEPGMFFLIKLDGYFLVVRNVVKPYMPEPKKAAESMDSPQLRYAVASHQTWLLLDMIITPPRATPQRVQRMIGRLAAVLAGSDCLAICCPELDKWTVYNLLLNNILMGPEPPDAFDKSLLTKPLVEALLLFSEPRRLDRETLIRAATKTFGNVYKTEELPFLAVGDSPSFLIQFRNYLFWLYDSDKPYPKIPQVKPDLTDPNLADSLAKQQAWVSIALLQKPDKGTDEQAYQRMGRLINAVAGKECLAVYTPTTSQWGTCDQTYREKLSADPSLVLVGIPHEEFVRAAAEEAARKAAEEEAERLEAEQKPLSPEESLAYFKTGELVEQAAAPEEVLSQPQESLEDSLRRLTEQPEPTEQPESSESPEPTQDQNAF